MERLLYIFKGDSSTLKIAGPVLLAISIISPVLVSGISLKDVVTSTTTHSPASQEQWAGWTDDANLQYDGGQA